MLCLTRRIGETILVGDQVAITVTRVKGRQVGLALAAPKEIQVLRAELAERTDDRPEKRP